MWTKVVFHAETKHCNVFVEKQIGVLNGLLWNATLLDGIYSARAAQAQQFFSMHGYLDLLF